MLDDDLRQYPVNSGAFTRQTFADNEVSEVQKNMEATVGEFLVDDLDAFPQAEDGDIGFDLEN